MSPPAMFRMVLLVARLAANRCFEEMPRPRRFARFVISLCHPNRGSAGDVERSPEDMRVEGFGNYHKGIR